MNIIEDYITKYKLNDNNISKPINNNELINMLELIKNELISINTNLETANNKLNNINNKLDNINNKLDNIDNNLDNIDNNLIYEIFTNNKNNIIILTLISLSSFYIYKLK